MNRMLIRGENYIKDFITGNSARAVGTDGCVYIGRTIYKPDTK
jgi:hypothetical protein